MSTKKKLTMDELLSNEDSVSVQQLRRGDIVEGTIIEVNEREALVDVGAKSEGVIPQSELKGKDYKVGDKVLVYVLTPEDRRGQMIVSLNKAEVYKAWGDMEKAFKEGRTLDFVITGHNRGGLVGNVSGIVAFIPFSHSESASDLALDKAELQSLLDKMVGKTVKARIIELDREKNRIILSEKEAVIGEALDKRRERLASLDEGQVVSVEVTAIMPYGLVVSVDGVEGLIPREEISWDDESIDERLAGTQVGEKMDAQVINIDEEMGKVKLSLKSISSNPWEELAKQYKEGDTTEATVSRITSYGVFATVGDGIEGMIPLTSIPEDKKLAVGQPIKVKLDVIDMDKKRVDLSFTS